MNNLDCDIKLKGKNNNLEKKERNDIRNKVCKYEETETKKRMDYNFINQRKKQIK